MPQQGQILKLKTRNQDGEQLWAYRYRVAGRGSKRLQRGGFSSEYDAQQALARAIDLETRPTCRRHRTNAQDLRPAPHLRYLRLTRRHLNLHLSRYMGASPTMIDRHYGHLARDGREHAIRLLDAHTAQADPPVDVRGRFVDVASELAAPN